MPAVALLARMKRVSVESIRAVLVASFVFSSRMPADQRRQANDYEEGGTTLVAVPGLLPFGLTLPWKKWTPALWLAAAFAARRDLAFQGWLGPLGLSAIHCSTDCHRDVGHNPMWAIGCLGIFASIVAHGLTAAPFTR
ncbi:MAG TPA: hypothetical protein VHE13_15375 [Opitutus sp.]|nr:hypothetical protein [Opitutus sp.]